MLKPELPEQTDCPAPWIPGSNEERNATIGPCSTSESRKPHPNGWHTLCSPSLHCFSFGGCCDCTFCERGDEHSKNRGGCPSLQNLATNWRIQNCASYTEIMRRRLK